MMAKGIIIATSFGQRSGRPENKVSRSAFLLPTEQESRKGVLSGTVTLYAADIAAQKVEETILSKTADFIRSRKGATILLAAATLVGSIFISSNLSAVKVTDGSEKQTVVTGKTADTMQIIDQAGFALSDNDAYSVDGADSAVKAIKIFRAFDIKVIDGGKEKTISAVSGTVGEALANAGIDLPDEDDVMSVTLDADAEEDMTVRIDRVKVVKSTATKTVSYKTVTKNDSSLESGKTKVSVEGVNGTKEVTTTKKYVNGKLTETKTSEKVTKKAVDKVGLIFLFGVLARRRTTLRQFLVFGFDLIGLVHELHIHLVLLIKAFKGCIKVCTRSQKDQSNVVAHISCRFLVTLSYMRISCQTIPNIF